MTTLTKVKNFLFFARNERCPFVSKKSSCGHFEYYNMQFQFDYRYDLKRVVLLRLLHFFDLLVVFFATLGLLSALFFFSLVLFTPAGTFVYSVFERYLNEFYYLTKIA